MKLGQLFKSTLEPYHRYRIMRKHRNGDVTLQIFKDFKSEPFVDRWPKWQIEDILPVWECAHASIINYWSPYGFRHNYRFCTDCLKKA